MRGFGRTLPTPRSPRAEVASAPPLCCVPAPAPGRSCPASQTQKSPGLADADPRGTRPSSLVRGTILLIWAWCLKTKLIFL